MEGNYNGSRNINHNFNGAFKTLCAMKAPLLDCEVETALVTEVI